MAPSASEEEQGKEEADTVAPAAAPEPQQDAHSLRVEMAKKTIEEALSLLGACRARYSEMLDPMGDDSELRGVEFLEQELSYIVPCLMAASPQHPELDKMMEMLQGWSRMWPYFVSTVLREADPRRRALLRRAVRFLRLRRHPLNPYWVLYEVRELRGCAERCRRLLVLAPQAEEGGVDRFKPPSREFACDTNVLTFYMGMFPYGYKFEKHRLVTKWFREGIVKYWAEVPHCFNYLVDSNIITRAEANSRRSILPDESETWQLNASHTEFLATKSAEVGFHFTSATLNLLAATSAQDHGNQASMIPRRLALHHDDPNIPSLLQKIDLSHSQTRSLAVSGAVNGVPVDKFVNLVLLDVEGWENFGDDDLLKVCRSKMFFLQYLSIRNTRVTKLPPEMKELHSLRVLDASNTQITELPLRVFVAISLWKLDLRGTPIRQLTLPKQIGHMKMQYSLEDLLVGGEGVINSAETATIVPHDIWRFRNLHTLATIDLSDQPASLLKALGDLVLLTVLAITWSFYQSSDTDSCEALLSSIEKWKYLQSLTIHCGLGCSMEFLSSLSNMPSCLKTFQVTLGRFASVPQWFHGLMHLSFVQITVCKLEVCDLDILRGLPALKCLLLGLDFIPSEAIVIRNEGFLELQRFSIDCPVPWLTFESGALPKLTYLQLNFRACPTSTISVPLGISNLRGLTEIALWYNVRYANSSSVKMTVEAVRNEVSQCRSTTKKIGLFINGIEQDDAQAVDEDTQKCPNGTNAGAINDVQAVDEGTTSAVQSEITEAES